MRYQHFNVCNYQGKRFMNKEFRGKALIEENGYSAE